jgi:hypothetical protein
LASVLNSIDRVHPCLLNKQQSHQYSSGYGYMDYIGIDYLYDTAPR